MAITNPDPGWSALAAQMPCFIRRYMNESSLGATNTSFDFFPWKGQNIDTPATAGPKWTSDDDTRPLT